MSLDSLLFVSLCHLTHYYLSAYVTWLIILSASVTWLIILSVSVSFCHLTIYSVSCVIFCLSWVISVCLMSLLRHLALITSIFLAFFVYFLYFFVFLEHYTIFFSLFFQYMLDTYRLLPLSRSSQPSGDRGSQKWALCEVFRVTLVVFVAYSVFFLNLIIVLPFFSYFIRF